MHGLHMFSALQAVPHASFKRANVLLKRPDISAEPGLDSELWILAASQNETLDNALLLPMSATGKSRKVALTASGPNQLHSLSRAVPDWSYHCSRCLQTMSA